MGLINHICLSFAVLILWMSPAIEQMLYGWYLFGVEMGKWGALQGPHSHAKILCMAQEAPGGPCGLVIVVWCGLFFFSFDLGDGGGVL